MRQINQIQTKHGGARSWFVGYEVIFIVAKKTNCCYNGVEAIINGKESLMDQKNRIQGHKCF